MRKFIYGVAVGIACALVVAVIRQQQEAARSAPLMRRARETIEQVEREMAEERTDGGENPERIIQEMNRSYENINQTISHIRTLINDQRRVN